MSALFGMQHIHGEVQWSILVRHDYQSQVARILSCKICRGLKKKSTSTPRQLCDWLQTKRHLLLGTNHFPAG